MLYDIYPMSGYCACFWVPQYKEVIDKLGQVQRRASVMVWAGAEGQRELGWFSWRKDGFGGRIPKVISNTHREVIRRWSQALHTAAWWEDEKLSVLVERGEV